MNKNHTAILVLIVFTACLTGIAYAQTSGNKTAPPTTTPQRSINALAPQASAASIESCNNKMQALLAALDKGDYQGAEMDFNDTIKAGLAPDQLKQAWQSLPAKFGTAGMRGAAQASMSNGYTVITVPMQYQNGSLAAQVACGTNGKIAGFHVLTMPPSVAAPASTPG